MRYKILTVDDSKTVRIIVRKAFKAFDCEILEANNGAEGLTIAAKDAPHLILLDVTMPVMDGVEMLTRLKADPQLKAIPVIMLTAEGGRDNVLKIAKIGIRDYLIKPFKEESLVEKVGRVLSLKPLSEQPVQVRSLFDPADILVVDDKPVIIQQIQEGLKHTPWKIHGVSTQKDALEFCGKTLPDLALISLSLPEEGAFSLFRVMRTNVQTKHMPIFALAVKTESEQQKAAQNLGFSIIITKPIDFAEFETKICKAMNLDTSQRYFRFEGGYLVMHLPENCSPAVVTEISSYIKAKVSAAVDAGQTRVVIDMHELKTLNLGVIKMLVGMMQICRELTLQFALVGNPQIIEDCKGFEDTKGWVFHTTLDEAKATLGNPTAAPQLVSA